MAKSVFTKRYERFRAMLIERIAASADFLVVGAYPAGQEGYDLMRGELEEQATAEQRIAAVPLPSADPIYGDEGPLLERWSAK